MERRYHGEWRKGRLKDDDEDEQVVGERKGGRGTGKEESETRRNEGNVPHTNKVGRFTTSSLKNLTPSSGLLSVESQPVSYPVTWWWDGKREKREKQGGKE